MTDAPFGERYFATRECLAGVMRGIAALAGETSTDITGRLPLAEIDHGLGNPFLFVVCGEVNAGKSSLINGLFGRDLCRVNVLPETDRVLWYRYAPTARDNAVTPLLEERYRPIDFLKDFNLVDTPGTNSTADCHQEITEQFLPNADLILFVFPVTNPWGAATWNLITSLPVALLDKIAFVIQQADQRDPGDIDVILGHMADLSMKRIGRVPHIFAVSGKLAFQAKRSTPFAGAMLKASGYPALEDFISKNVCHSPVRRRALETWRSQAASALRAVEDRIEERTRSLTGQTRFLDEVELEIQGIRETFVARLTRHLAAVTEVFDTQALRVSRILRGILNPFRSFLRVITGDRTSHEIEEVFIDHLKRAVIETAGKDGDELVHACLAHWQELGERVRKEMDTDLSDSAAVGTLLAEARTRFVARLGAAATRGIGNLKVRSRLDKEIRRRNLALKSFSIVTLLLLTGGAACGALHLPWLPWIFCCLAGLSAIGGFVIAWISRNTITRNFSRHLLDTCGAFAATLRLDYEEALRSFFRAYAESLDALRDALAREKLAIEPRLSRWHELFLTLKAIEQDL